MFFSNFTKMTMQRIFGCAILNIRETASQATQSSQDRRDELDVRLAVPSAQSARGMEIGMNILLINGSPKGDRSNTLKLSKAFLEGVLEIHKDAEIRQMNLSEKKIAPCRGCFACWNKTPGKCVMTDDMQEGIEGELWADLMIWSFPLYYFSVPGLLKNFIDRQLPMNLPFMEEQEGQTGSGGHPSRYDMSGKRHLLISTCGFYTAKNNYDSVTKLFDHVCGAGQYESIFCGQGELFRVPELKARTDEYLECVRQAGREYAQKQAISEGTKEKLRELLYPRDVFEKMADASWGVEKNSGEKEDPVLTFTRQMAALYNKDSFDQKERVLEIRYTDLGKAWQIVLGKDGSTVLDAGSREATTVIETPWDVWQSIARGEIRGDVALAKGMYRVTGDFSLMIHWDDFFGAANAAAGKEKSGKNSDGKTAEKEKQPQMIFMLAAWITFWVAVSVGGNVGAIVTLAICACLPLAAWNRKLTVYDRLSFGIVALLSVLALQKGCVNIALLAGYLGFGLMWLLSCLTKEPLCAAYVKYNYHGDDALENPIFMKTNRILAAGWGVLYILIAIWSAFLLPAGHTALMQILNNTATVLMGIFTGWFEKWYPQRVAAGK